MISPAQPGTDRQPGASVACDEPVGSLRTGAAGRVVRKVAGRPRGPGIEDRLHGNELGHERVAAALAWRLGLPGFDDSWEAEPEDELVPIGRATGLVSDLDWVVHYFGPWLGRGIRGIPHGLGITAKRPELAPVAKTNAPAVRDA